MSMTYAQYVVRLGQVMGAIQSDFDWSFAIPAIIDYAEQRLYRELDLLATVVRDSTATATANDRNFILPSTAGRFVTVDGINIYTPVSTTTTRNALTPVSRDWLDWAWPTNTAASATTVPESFCWVSDGDAGAQTVLFGPPPGAAFTVEVIGTIRPTPLSSSNTSTFLSAYLPDIFLAASMIQAASYLPGGQSQVWEAEYQKLFPSANVEESRKKFASVSWTSKQPEPVASTPQRG
jgi:hypothetical protein